MSDPRIITRFPSSFKGQPISESQISSLVGLETYKALYYYWPSLYYEVNYPMTPQKPYLDAIQSIIASHYSASTSDVGTYLKSDLIRMVAQGTDTLGIGASLVGTSQPITYFNSTPQSKAIDLVMAFIWITVTVWVFYIIGVTEFIFKPVPIHVGLNLFS